MNDIIADMDNGDLGKKIDALRAELPGMIEAAVGKHEETFVHMTQQQYSLIAGEKSPEQLIKDHTELEKGQEYMIAQLKLFSEQQEKFGEQQDYIAEVVLGPESTNYDGEVTRSGGLQTLGLDINQKGEIKTRLSTRDRVALYVAGIGGTAAIIAALLMAFA